jgi:hypothetical protein
MDLQWLRPARHCWATEAERFDCFHLHFGSPGRLAAAAADLALSNLQLKMSQRKNICVKNSNLMKQSIWTNNLTFCSPFPTEPSVMICCPLPLNEFPVWMSCILKMG